MKRIIWIAGLLLCGSGWAAAQAPAGGGRNSSSSAVSNTSGREKPLYSAQKKTVKTETVFTKRRA